MKESEDFSGSDFRNVLGAFATGVTVITTFEDGHPYGMTANAFSSLSLDPPMVLACIVSGARGCAAIQHCGIFAVNILTAEQEALSRFFASRNRPRGRDAFAEVAHRRGVTGAPLLDGVAAYLDCRLAETYRGGDHTIVIGEVLALGHAEQARPLLFHRGGYAALAPAARSA